MVDSSLIWLLIAMAAVALWNRGGNLRSLAFFAASAVPFALLVGAAPSMLAESGWGFWLGVALVVALVLLMAVALEAGYALILRAPLQSPARTAALLVAGYAPLVLLGVVYTGLLIFLLGE